MKQAIVPGGSIDAVTPAELRAAVREELARGERIRIRDSETGKTDATGAIAIDVYNVPAGFEFEARRLTVDADGITFGSAVVPVDLQILRSGRRIAFLSAEPGNLNKIPNVQTWSREAGPYLRNGEIFQVLLPGGQVAGLQNAGIAVTLEGILYRPARVV